VNESSFPPPPGSNPVTQTWYLLQRERQKRLDLQQEFDDFKAQTLREIGELRGDVRALKLRARRSGHDLEEIKQWQEDSQIRDLKEQLAEAQRRVAERSRGGGGKWDRRMWGLVSAIVLTIITAFAAALTQGHAPKEHGREHAEPAGAHSGGAP